MPKNNGVPWIQSGAKWISSIHSSTTFRATHSDSNWHSASLACAPRPLTKGQPVGVMVPNKSSPEQYICIYIYNNECRWTLLCEMHLAMLRPDQSSPQTKGLFQTRSKGSRQKLDTHGKMGRYQFWIPIHPVPVHLARFGFASSR